MRALLTSTILFLLILGFLTPTTLAVEDASIRPGDFALYRSGEWCQPIVPLYPPHFGIQEPDIRVWGAPCPAELRWEVLSAADGTIEASISMKGWQVGVSSVEGVVPSEKEKEIKEVVRTALNTSHTVRVDLGTMDVTLPDGTYVGRWDFLLTTAEVASGRTEITRNWFGGTVLQGNVTVADDLVMDSEVYLQDVYGVSTFAWTESDCGPAPWKQPCPLPPNLEQYLATPAGGWQTLHSEGKFHDATTLLLLFSIGGAFYSDLLFQLYGIIWQDSPEQVSLGVIPMSFIRLVDTNIITLPGAEPGDGEGTGPGDGVQPGDGGPIGSPVPWEAMILLPVAAGAATVLAYLHLRPRRWKETGEATGPTREERFP